MGSKTVMLWLPLTGSRLLSEKHGKLVPGLAIADYLMTPICIYRCHAILYDGNASLTNSIDFAST